ncbi:MAG: hypothetical protein PWQ20_843 [Thermotogaceae bacterium]|nr:hypothetical protein [Thermotogaceae bacterium]MDN5337773.1 hypothetical protein [Thermotogaceae bacterium]
MRKLIYLTSIFGFIFIVSACCFLYNHGTPISEDEGEYGYLSLKLKLPSDFDGEKYRYIPSNSEKIRISIFNPDVDGQNYKYVEDIDLSGQSGTVERNLKLKARDNYLIGVAAIKDVVSSFESVYCSDAAAILSLDFATFSIEKGKNSTVSLILEVPEATITTTQIPDGPSESYSATLTVRNVDFELLESFGFDVPVAFYYYSTDPLNSNILMHTTFYDFSNVSQSTDCATFSNLKLYTPASGYEGVLYCQLGFELGEFFDNPNGGGLENAWLLFPEVDSTSKGYVLTDYGSITIIVE